MLYNKRNARKINDKKITHKVGKTWVTISLTMLMVIGGEVVNTSTNIINHNQIQAKRHITKKHKKKHRKYKSIIAESNNVTKSMADSESNNPILKSVNASASMEEASENAMITSEENATDSSFNAANSNEAQIQAESNVAKSTSEAINSDKATINDDNATQSQVKSAKTNLVVQSSVANYNNSMISASVSNSISSENTSVSASIANSEKNDSTLNSMVSSEDAKESYVEASESISNQSAANSNENEQISADSASLSDAKKDNDRIKASLASRIASEKSKATNSANSNITFNIFPDNKPESSSNNKPTNTNNNNAANNSITTSASTNNINSVIPYSNNQKSNKETRHKTKKWIHVNKGTKYFYKKNKKLITKIIHKNSTANIISKHGRRLTISIKGHHYIINKHNAHIAYLNSKKNNFHIKVLSNIKIHSNKNFTKRNTVKAIKKGHRIKIHRIVQLKNGVTRLELPNHNYLTSNRYFVKISK